MRHGVVPVIGYGDDNSVNVGASQDFAVIVIGLLRLGHLLSIFEPRLPDITHADELYIVLLLLAWKEVRSGQPRESHARSDKRDIDAIVRAQDAALDRVYRRDLLFV